MTELTIHYEGEIVTRQKAKELGLKRYFTGKPCKYGHTAQRLTSTSSCTACYSMYAKKYIENGGREKKKSCMRKWKLLNKAKHCQLNKKSRLKNLDKVKERLKKYISKNPNVVRVCSQNRRARERNASGSFSKKDIHVLLNRQKEKCLNCNESIRKNYHIDHIMPLALGGSNWPSNLQLLCPHCNQLKHAKHPIDWALENGRLV